MTDLYITTSIPYVNGAPHLGHALEFVHADVLARHRRERGAAVRLQSGTDDHAIKNVAAAAAVGVPVAEFVAAHGDWFAELTRTLGIDVDEFLRTSRDPRHAASVTALWTACARSGDLYRRPYTGRYCAGCEQFYTVDELVGGACPEHGARAVEVTETNWFFRLSRYRRQIVELIVSGRLEIVPRVRRNEVLGFLAGAVHDLSVSRSAARASGWGIAVPGDQDQIVYVWFDALANYLTGLGYPDDDATVRRWWGYPTERVHVVGKGIARFHAVYWIAFLLSAGLPLPTRLLVHDYLTVDGAKIAKSGAHAAAPDDVVARYGADAVRWWLLRDPAPVGTTDFTVARLVSTHDHDLANTIGNLASRTLALARRPGAWRTAPRPPGRDPAARELLDRIDVVADEVDLALERYDLRAGAEAIVRLAEAGNRYLEAEAPWRLARSAEAGDAAAAQRFETVIAEVLATCRTVAAELRPFLPRGSDRLARQLLDAAAPVAFPRIGA